MRRFLLGRSLLPAISVLFMACGISAAQNGMLSFGPTFGSVWTPDHPALNAAPLTAEGWFLANGTSGGSSGIIIHKGDSSNTFSLGHSQEWGGFLNANLFFPTALVHLVSPQVLQSNTWYHAALTFDATSATLYLDGEIQDSEVLPGAPQASPGEPLLLGSTTGYLDELRIWSTVRTQAQIQETMHRRLDFHPNLVSAWHFDGNLQDLTGLHHGTVPFGSAFTVPSTSPVGPLLAAASSVQIWSTLAYSMTHCAPASQYLLEVSITGTSPGIPIPAPFPSGTFPLNPPFLFATYGSLLPSLFSGFVGVTDSSGAASGTLFIPPEPALIGIELSAAFAAFDAQAAGTMFAGVSRPVTTTIESFPPTAITQIAPVIAQPGSFVTVTGEGFRPATAVEVAGAAVNLLSLDATELTFVAPTNVPCDSVVTVLNAGGQASAPYNPSPVIVSTSNSSGPASGGQTMFLVGAHFVPGTTVTIGGTPAQITFSFETILAVVVPPGVPGPAQVIVTSPTGCTDSTIFDYS